jgi:hypothetical protein
MAKKALNKTQRMDRFINSAATKLHGVDWRTKFSPEQVRETLSSEIRSSVLSKAQRDSSTAMTYYAANTYFHNGIKRICQSM